METLSNANRIFSQQGKKSTIFKFSDMGFPQAIQCEIKEVYRKNYAQYNDIVHIVYRPKGKRTDYVMRVYDYSSYLIYNGFVDLEAEMFVKTLPKTSPDSLVVRESLICFSNDYVSRAMSSTSEQPIFSQLK